jgi:hypothetical protein
MTARQPEAGKESETRKPNKNSGRKQSKKNKAKKSKTNKYKVQKNRHKNRRITIPVMFKFHQKV